VFVFFSVIFPKAEKEFEFPGLLIPEMNLQKKALPTSHLTFTTKFSQISLFGEKAAPVQTPHYLVHQIAHAAVLSRGNLTTI